MFYRLIIALLLLASLPALAIDRDFRYREASPTSVIEDTMCITALNSDTCLHVDEEVPNLIIEVLGPNGVLIKSFSCTADCEDISVLGTFATPTADSVRVSPQETSTGDYTQMMFENVVYDGYAWVEICVTDGNATIDDFCRHVYLDGVSSKDVGLLRKGTVSTVTTQQQVVTDIDFTDDDVLLGNTITLEDVTTGELVSRWVSDIAASTDSITYDSVPEFDIDVGDIVRIYATVHPRYLTYARLGAPAGASISADVAAVQTAADATLVDTGTTLPATLGSPAGASLAADVAAVKVDTAATLVDTGTTLPATLGTPVGADMTADITAAQSDITAIKAKTDDITFTKANEVDVNLLSINDCTITGDGNAVPLDSAC